ncbi:MAG: hypothetical protein Q3977_03565, partial [Oscillospiraceae bacterium]|nr:hypothetical protein [Oscillospiraceae bacterium]
AAAALGAGQFKFRTPETEGRTQVCSDFFFWGIQKPVFFFDKTNHPQKVVQPFAERRSKGAGGWRFFQKRRSLADFATTQNGGLGTPPLSYSYRRA